MGQLAEDNARRFLVNPRLADDLIRRLSKDPAVLDAIVDDLIDALEDAIEDDDRLRRKLLATLSRNKAFRRRVTLEVTQNIQ